MLAVASWRGGHSSDRQFLHPGGAAERDRAAGRHGRHRVESRSTVRDAGPCWRWHRGVGGTRPIGSSSILAALLNAIVLLVVTGGIAWEAVQRFGTPAHVGGGIVAWVALVGVGINTATALLFMRGRKNDLNIRGAFLHMAADAAVSAGVMVAGVAILVAGGGGVGPGWRL